MTHDEFSRSFSVDGIGGTPRTVTLTAEPEECARIAQRFGWRAVTHLTASATLHNQARGIVARGTLQAEVVQDCAATGAPLAEAITADFDLLFAAGEDAPGKRPDATPEEEVELSATDLDVIEFDGRAINLGEAVAQSLALAVPLFPRSAEAEAALRVAGITSDDGAEAAETPLARALKRALPDSGTRS